MPATIVYTTGLTFAILILTYVLINKTGLTQKIFARIPIYRLIQHKNPANIHLDNYAMRFKIQSSLKQFMLSLITTLLFAFILYNYLFFTVPISNSMRPTFEAGDLVLMQKFDTEPHEGDIIMFGMAMIGKDQIITHRVYSVTAEGVKTKGDASPVDSWTLPPEQIYAKAITIGGQAIVIKSVGTYFLDAQVSSTYASEFGFIQALARGGKQLGLLIFVICLVAYTWLSVNDMKRQKKYRRN